MKKRESVPAQASSATSEREESRMHRTVLLLGRAQRILFTLGLSLLALYGVARLEGWLGSRTELENFHAPELPAYEASATPEAADAPDVNTPPDSDFSAWAENRLRAYKKSLSTQFGAPLAVLQIPKIHLAVPLLDGTDDLTLNHAVGRIPGTARPGEPGNLGIAGHRDGFFRGLKDVKAGDLIELKTRQGKDTYVVDRTEIVTPDNVGVLKPGNLLSLTLVTCYPFYFLGSAPKRFVVTAKLTQRQPAESTTSEIRPSTQTEVIPGGTMINITRKSHLFALQAFSAVVLTLAGSAVHAQDTVTSRIRHGEPSYETKVRNAHVIYVEGNDLVLKLEDGKVEHMVVPADEKFNIDGREVTVSDLKPGTKLTQTITTTTTPRYVNTVRTLKGRVWHVNAPSSVILTLPDGTNQPYKVPSHATFTVNGQKKTVFDLKKGMRFEATIITDDPQTVVVHDKSTVGQAPAPATPPLVGVLLVEKPAAAPSQVEVASSVTAEHADTLPNTATNLPLVGLLGVLGVGSALGLGRLRRAFKVKA